VTASSPEKGPFKDPWFWSTVGLSLAWLTTLGIWFVKGRHRPEDLKDASPEKVQKTETLPVTDAFKSLKKACETGDRVGAREALKAFSLERWPDLDAEGRQAALKSLLGEDLEALDRGLYGQTEASWDGRALWKRLETRLLDSHPKAKKAAPNLLESLYKV